MRMRLKRGAEVRVAYERFVSRALGERIGGPQETEAVWMKVRISSRESSSNNLNLMLEALHDHGAIVDRVDADGMICEFMSRYTGDEPLERALRCGLALLSSNAWRPRAHGGEGWPNPNSTSYWKWQQVGVDLLADTAFHKSSKQVYRRRNHPSQERQSVYAIKASV